ncbi:hypothetical protein GFS31_42520 (plasmid) [Leptolyngbya sp. BL0902]|nr:hypothetical protein GFS31_42520 [Leptolyngbya sp. BL0902]
MNRLVGSSGDISLEIETLDMARVSNRMNLDFSLPRTLAWQAI